MMSDTMRCSSHLFPWHIQVILIQDTDLDTMLLTDKMVTSFRNQIWTFSMTILNTTQTHSLQLLRALSSWLLKCTSDWRLIKSLITEWFTPSWTSLEILVVLKTLCFNLLDGLLVVTQLSMPPGQPLQHSTESNYQREIFMHSQNRMTQVLQTCIRSSCHFALVSSCG